MDNQLRRKYLFSDKSIPRRTEYRKRKEAELAALRQQVYDSDSSDTEAGGEDHRHRPLQNKRPHIPSENCDMFSSNDSFQEGEHSECEVNSSSESETQNEYNSTDISYPNESDSERMEENNFDDTPIQSDGSRHSDDNTGEFVNGQHKLLDSTLSQCTSTTEGDALLMVLALAIRHNLTWVAVTDILKMINNLYGREVIHSSKYFFMKYFDQSKDSTVVHMYCPVCEKHLGSKEDVMKNKVLQCDCGQSVDQSSFFISVSLKHQFKELMEDPGIADEVKTYRFQRTKKASDSYEDVFDGDGYKKFSEPPGILSDPHNFSITINTDGLALGDSTSRSAWPIFLYINELSPVNRKKHIIFAGIWVDKKQPNMRILLKPFINELHELSTHGFEWRDGDGQKRRSKVVLLIAVLDSGARYKFLNLTSFSGYYGCTLCYQKAENTTKGRRFTVPTEAAPLRTHESMLRDMRIAHENKDSKDAKKRVFKGCKGMTPLVFLHPHLDLGTGVIVDFMHNGLLGVTRSNTALLLQTAGAPYYIGSPEKLHVINGRLLSIKPPKSITRTPRPLSDAKIYKASEWRSLLILYGLPCYENILPLKYVEHFAMLSSAFYILLNDSINNEQLLLADRYLRQYVFLTEEYYGKHAMTYNIHLLLHVTAAVKNWGPIWGPNTFVFEGENRHLSQMTTSPGEIALQLARRYQMFSAYPKYCDMFASSETPVNFIREITGRNFQSYLCCGETVLIGKGVMQSLSAVENRLLRDAGVIPLLQDALYFVKILHKGVRFTTRAYAAGKKNDDSWVKMKCGVRGTIENILLVKTEDKDIVALFLHEISIENHPAFTTKLVSASHLRKVSDIGILKLFQPADICQQCIYMDLDNGKFIVDLPYGCYSD